VEATKENNKMVLCVAFSYGGRIEVLDACQKIVDSGKMVITEDNFRNYLYDADMPDVDLLIRTSGEQRISNFLLWQSAYAELYFSPKYWPDFNETDLMRAIDEYSKRKRNFGAR
jgi:undecaprenyl diphosphate synthase